LVGGESLLRPTRIRRRGVAGRSDSYKANVLESYIDDLLADQRDRAGQTGDLAR
jgi:hypothetical protein